MGSLLQTRVREGDGWRPCTHLESQQWAWLPEPQAADTRLRAAPWHGLPFQPLSFRDCSLYERHWVQSSRGYAKRFLPHLAPFTTAYERLTGRVFPTFRPAKLAYARPVYYFGNHLTFVPSGTPIRVPRFTQALDYELELGLVLRASLRNATPQEALQAIGGFVVVNDWSARDIQRAEMQTGLGPQKCKHFMSSMSAELVEAADVWPRIEHLQAWVEINGRVVSRTSTEGMLHNWCQTLSMLSEDETLHAGELVASGTLPGGCAMENGHWVQPGDRLRLVIEGVGEIQHEVLA